MAIVTFKIPKMGAPKAIAKIAGPKAMNAKASVGKLKASFKYKK